MLREIGILGVTQFGAFIPYQAEALARAQNLRCNSSILLCAASTTSAARLDSKNTDSRPCQKVRVRFLTSLNCTHPPHYSYRFIRYASKPQTKYPESLRKLGRGETLERNRRAIAYYVKVNALPQRGPKGGNNFTKKLQTTGNYVQIERF